MRSFSLAAASIAGAIFISSSTAFAQQPPAQAAAATPESPATPISPQLTRADLEAWLDGLMPYALERGNIAGSVVVVVKDGETLLQKGYGYADLEKRRPVDPARTLFRPGSVSKLFTWTAVMQQVERGKLDLDADVNTYLDFEIPPGPGGSPVRVRDLMTHTPGFEEAVKELIQDDESRLMPLGDVLKRWVPTRIFEAGKMPAYSNYGTALAGYLVERVSGVPFDDYIEKNIFAPLGMHHSTFRQPLPKALRGDMAEGYEDASGKPEKYELVNMAPAGSLAAPGADMARFMIAHLQKGAFGDQRILGAETAEKMHGTPLTIIPKLNRMVLGFYETNTNGRRIVSHGGDTQYFHSDLQLYLDEGVGYFISVNSLGKEGAAGDVRSAFFKEFSNRYFPGPPPAGEIDKKIAEEHARLIAGTYLSSRRIESSFLSVLNMLSPVKVTVDDKGFVMIPQVTGLNGEPVKWREIEPFVWAEVNGKERLAAEVVDGRVTRFSVGWISPFIFFERAPAARAGGWLMPAAAAGFGALTLTWLLWPVAALVRRHYRQPLPFGGDEARAYRWVRIGALATTLAMAAWVGLVFMMFDDLNLLSPRLDPWIRILHIVGTIAVLAGLALAAWHLWVVWRAKRRWLAKIWSVVLVLASLVMTWIAYVYHLFGIGTDY